MPLHERENALQNAPFDELLTVLFKQFKRLLAAKGIVLSESDIEAIARQIAEHGAADERLLTVRAALVELVAESEGVLAQWNLTFQQSLATNMDALPGWETTAEFLDIANEKSNAEIRIAAGSALAAALDDLRYEPYLRHLAEGDYDVDSIFARRVLEFLEDK